MQTRILHTLCSIPTAPFAEHHVIAYLRQFAARRPRLSLRADHFGNLLLQLNGASPRLPRWVFAAHMDHPGLVAERMLDPVTLLARFHGGVHIDYVRNARFRIFPPSPNPPRPFAEITARVIDAAPDPADRPSYPARLTLRLPRPLSIPAGSPGVFDLPTARVRGNRFSSRVCDDLAGAAAALSMLDSLARASSPPPSTISLLFTRAEEEGFIGALAAVSSRTSLLRRSDRIVAIETSAQQPYAPLGHGAIIRVGDRTSIFNSDLTSFLSSQAHALAQSDPSLSFQRALMPGGTCEATVYDAYGFLASSICIPLGNYHNMDPVRRVLAPEFIDLRDWTSMTRLFLRLAKNGHLYKPGHHDLKSRLSARFKRFKPLLK